MNSRSARCASVLLLLLFPLGLWRLGAEDPPTLVPSATAQDPEATWDWQVRIIIDRPPFPDFTPGGKRLPAGGRAALVLVLASGADPGKAVRDLAAIAQSCPGADPCWASPDAATAGKVPTDPAVPGGFSESVTAMVPPGLRPALLVVSPDGRVCFGHVPGSPWDATGISHEVAALRHKGDPKTPSREAPAPRNEFSGALACAACHRAQFVDWALTPHSIAWRDLRETANEGSEACIGCHVTGWKQAGGFADPRTDRRLADVQCETCHDPARTHAGEKRLRTEEYAARCRTCHTPSASIVADVRKELPRMSHRAAGSADRVTFNIRQESIRKFREAVYFQFCARTEYVGSAACKTCHETIHKQWAGTPHAGAFRTLKKAGRDSDDACIQCHVTGVGHEGGFQGEKLTPRVAEVGCESCHGPGKLHVEATTTEGRLATIFRFDEKCPTCVVKRICSECHDERNDPDFDLGKALERVKHKEK